MSLVFNTSGIQGLVAWFKPALKDLDIPDDLPFTRQVDEACFILGVGLDACSITGKAQAVMKELYGLEKYGGSVVDEELFKLTEDNLVSLWHRYLYEGKFTEPTIDKYDECKPWCPYYHLQQSERSRITLTPNGVSFRIDLTPKSQEPLESEEPDDVPVSLSEELFSHEEDYSTLPFQNIVVPEGWEGPFFGQFLRGNVSGRKKGVGRFDTFEEAVEAASKIENCNGITYEPGDKTHLQGFFLRLGRDGLETQEQHWPSCYADAARFVSWTKSQEPLESEEVEEPTTWPDDGEPTWVMTDENLDDIDLDNSAKAKAAEISRQARNASSAYLSHIKNQRESLCKNHSSATASGDDSNQSGIDTKGEEWIFEDLSYIVNSSGEVWDSDGKFYGHRVTAEDGGLTLKRLIPKFSEHGAAAKIPEIIDGQVSRESQFNIGASYCDDEITQDYEDFERMQEASTSEVYDMDEDRYVRRRDRFVKWQKEQDRRVLRTIGEYCEE